jgi:hypothetical protein
MLAHRLFICLCGIAAMFAESTAHQIDRRADEVVSIQVRTEKNKYRRSENLTFTVVLKNRSKHDVGVYQPLKIGGHDSFSVWLRERETGKFVAQPQIYESMLRLSPLRDSDLRPLRPGESLQTRFELPLSELGAEEALAYTLVVEFHSPISTEEAANSGRDVLSRDNGIASATTAFEVSPL